MVNAAAEARPASPILPTRAPGANILVVDDNAMNAKLLRMALEAYGYVVRVATNAAEARRLMTAQPPAVALLDVHMPEGDGLSLLREVRADRAMPYFPVVVVSAFVAGDDLDRAYAAGADAFLPKPVNLLTLQRVVGGLAAGGTGSEPA